MFKLNICCKVTLTPRSRILYNCKNVNSSRLPKRSYHFHYHIGKTQRQISSPCHEHAGQATNPISNRATGILREQVLRGPNFPSTQRPLKIKPAQQTKTKSPEHFKTNQDQTLEFKLFFIIVRNSKTTKQKETYLALD